MDSPNVARIWTPVAPGRRSLRFGNGEAEIGTSTSVFEAGKPPILKSLITVDLLGLSMSCLPGARAGFVSGFPATPAVAITGTVEGFHSGSRRPPHIQTPAATRPSKPAIITTSM